MCGEEIRSLVMCKRIRPWRLRVAAAGLMFASCFVQAQTASQQDAAVGRSVNYVFATDLGSGVYDLNGRTLQIYQLKYRKELRAVTDDQLGVRFEVPVTFGFFDFDPVDVISQGLPSRVDSFSVVPGISLDHVMENDWHVIPYVRAGFSIASSSVDGWLYGYGVRLQRRREYRGWDSLIRIELAVAGVDYRTDLPNDQFVRSRQGFDFTRGLGWKIFGREAELGLYAIGDFVLDPPTVPVVNQRQQPLQAELGFTVATRARFKIWRFDAPRLGFGYRFAGDLSGWRFVIGEPF
jgi:hypothetical protein